MSVQRCSLTLALMLCSMTSALYAQDDPFVAIPARMEEFMDEHEVSGAVTLVGHEGKVVHVAAVGSADIESARRMTTDAIFGIMSMTKPISATAFMMLVEEGKVSVDDP